MQKALFYEKLDDDSVKCTLCPRECLLSAGQRGYCQGRENLEGEMFSKIYGEISSIALDPIEKKPLYHFYPGREVLSVGTIGCNLKCEFCQNWQIAHQERATKRVSSADLIELASKHRSLGLAYTYSEPLIWYEYIFDTAKLAHEVGLKNILVTNGLINREPFLELLKYIDGINLDVKAYSNKFYQDICGGGYLETVIETAEVASKSCHLEVTTLLIPGLNDDLSEIRSLVKWLSNLNPEIPLHLNRYFPNYKLDLPPTSLERMEQAKDIAQEFLHYVYLGNLVNVDRNTFCQRCHYTVIKRDSQIKVNLLDGRCPECGQEIPIVI